MLLILTGDVQIGKTRWLQKAVAHLESAGIPCHGVLAPGVWVEREDGMLDKTGIDNLLLPGHELVPFARRADLAQQEDCFDSESQAAKAQLKWHISDDAIKYVNEHFRQLAATNMQGLSAIADNVDLHPTAANSPSNDANDGTSGPLPTNAPTVATASNDDEPQLPPATASTAAVKSERATVDTRAFAPKGILFVDELGQLELLHGKGLVDAVSLLAQGPRSVYEHAVVIARDRFGLPKRAEELFGAAWGGSVRISPDDAAWDTWIEPLLHRPSTN